MQSKNRRLGTVNFARQRHYDRRTSLETQEYVPPSFFIEESSCDILDESVKSVIDIRGMLEKENRLY